MGARVTSPRFVGRERELDEVLTAVHRSRSGVGTLMLVAGEAGVGKSRLVEEAVERVRRAGSLALVGRCIELGDSGAPYAPIRQAFRELRRALPGERLADLVGTRAADIAPLFPIEEPPGADTPPGPSIGPDTTQTRMFEAALDLLSSASAQRGLLLVIEDIHWADRSTLDLLTYFTRAQGATTFVPLVTFRSDELHRGHRLQPVLAELQRVRACVRIDLPRFDREELEQQLGAILGMPPSASMVDRVYARSGGNAFFAEEVVAADPADQPLSQGLRDVVLSRVAELGDDAERLLGVMSVGGMRVASHVLEHVTGRPSSELAPSLREAVDRHLLVMDAEDGIEYVAFRHALVQEAMYGELLPGERIRLHARFADALGAEPDPRTAAELAYHRYAAHDLPRALEASVMAGWIAERSHAFAVAEREYTRALELWEGVPDADRRAGIDRVELLDRAARAAAVSAPPRAAALVREALTICDPLDRTRHGLLKERYGTYSYMAGDGFTALDACREAVQLVPADPPTAARAQVLASLGQLLMILVRMEDASAVCGEAVEVARAVGAQDLESHALVSLGTANAYLGRLDVGMEQLGQAIELATAAGSVEAATRGHANRIDVLSHAGRFREAGDATLSAFAFAERCGLARVTGVIELADGALALYRLGAWREARDLLGRASRYDPTGVPKVIVEQRLALLEVGRGEHDAAAARIEGVRPLTERAIEAQLITPMVEAAAESDLWRGRPAEAWQEIARALDRLPIDEPGYISRIAPVLALGVRAAADLARDRGQPGSGIATGQPQVAAVRLVDVMTTLTGISGERGLMFTDQAHAWLSLCRAEQTRLQGRPSPGAWATAADAFGAIPMAYPQAYALWREGEAELVGERSRSRAAAPLRAAHAIAEELEAAPLRGAITALARAAHLDVAPVKAATPEAGRPDRRERSGLTRREVEVLRLIAAGQTNRQIAAHLFITEGTASTHVSHILDKFGVSTRTEAAAVAHRLGLAGS